ncbi:MAG: hypothetical protein AB7E32_16445 [Desulfovibrio sp.]
MTGTPARDDRKGASAGAIPHSMTITDTGRFTAQDPIGASGGDSDWYGYCLDDPVNGRDPEGLYECKDNSEKCGDKNIYCNHNTCTEDCFLCGDYEPITRDDVNMIRSFPGIETLFEWPWKNKKDKGEDKN